MADREGRLDTKVAIVTGGSSGIGEAIVHRFAREGARVVFCGRNEGTGTAVERAVRSDPVAASAGGDATFMQCDVTDETAVDALVQRTVDFYGRLDVIVANAGTGGGQLWPDEPTEVWDGFVKLNLNGMMFLCRAAWPHLVASGAGSAIAITSLSAWMGIGRDQLTKMGGAPSASYQASKAAMEGLVVHLAGRGGEHNVRVNAIRPGRILTDKFRAWMGDEGIFWNHYKEAQLIKRHGHVDDIANAALFLASDESTFITGTVLDVNGGAVVKL
jgi:NAD(P)-dependent dehydrogenase (short-subunit alcohol dehydrogenase family)